MDVVRCGWMLSVSLLFAACSQTTIPPPSSAFLAWSQQSPDAPKHVCVLPFVDRTGTPGLAEQVRRSFAGQLSLKHFVDSELYAIDAYLDAQGSNWRDHAAPDLGRTLGCEALIYGEVTKASRLYLALYSQLTLEGNIQMVETAAGRTLVHEAHATKFRSAGIPFSPLSVIPDAVKNLSNISAAQMTRAIDDLGRHLAMKVPDVPAPQAPHPPQLTHESASLLARADSPGLRPVSINTFAPSAQEAPPVQVSSSTPASPSSTANGTEQSVFSSAAAFSSPPTVSPDHEGYRLQIAAFSTQEKAERAVKLLQEKGYEPSITAATEKQAVWHRVTLGPFPSIHSAQEVGGEITKALPFSPIVIYPPTP